MLIAYSQENAMTRNLNIKLIAAAFVATSAASLFSMGSANASMTAELQNCKTNSRSHTIHCCQAIVGQNLPIWMRESGKNCKSVVKCRYRYCVVEIYFNLNQGGEGKKYSRRGGGLQ
jgi:hypothetical protein